MRLDDDLKYFEEPEFKEILAKYEAALEAGSALYLDADELTDVAEYYAMVVQDDERANEAIDLALDLHPGAVDPQIFKARQYMLKGDADKAREMCDAIEDQSHREVLFLRAELLVRDNRSEEATNDLLQAAEQVEEDKDYFLYDSAYIFIDYQQYDWALIFANDLEAMAPDWYRTWQLQADIALGMGNNNLAKKYITKMLDVDPFSIESWNWNAEAYSNLGQYAQAIESTDYSLAIEPDNERALQLKAWVLLQQGNTAEAHQIYTRLEEMVPDVESNWLYDSWALLDMGNVAAAEQAARRAEELADGMSPDQQAIYEQCAQVMSRKGDVEAALQYLEKAKADGTADEEFDPRLLPVRVYAENERIVDALNCLQSEMEKHPESEMSIYYNGALILFDYAFYDEAYSMLKEWMEVGDEKKEDMPYDYLAYTAMEIGMDEEALKYLRKAIDAGAPHLSELFAEKFPNVKTDELYDYYYYKVYGRWPE